MIAPQIVGRKAKTSHDTDVMSVPRITAWKAGILRVRKFTARVRQITVKPSVTRMISTSAFELR